MSVLPLIVALIAPSIAQYTYNPSCSSPLPSDPCENTNGLFSTSYSNIVADNGNRRNLDNVCHTYYPIEDKYCSYLAYLTGVYKDGSSTTLSFIVTSNSTNVFYYYSPYCSFEQTLLTNNNGVEIIVRRIISGECEDLVYPAFVSYPCLQYGSNNDLSQIKQVLTRNGYGYVDLIVLPRNLPTQCVTSQASTSTGSTVNCPGQYYGSPDSNEDIVSVECYPNYSYNTPSIPPYQYNPPTTGCGCP